jgi:transcriptional regulator with XRE-family HTH domain
MIRADDVPGRYPDEVILVAQIRAARALLNWSQGDLARAAGISEIALKRLETGSDPRISTINKIEAAFDAAGVVFLDPGDVRDGGPGVRFKRSGG